MVFKKILLSLCLCLAITPVCNQASFLNNFKTAPIFDPYDKMTQAQLVAFFGLCGIVVGALMAVREKQDESPIRATIETIAGLMYMPMGVLMVLFAGDIVDAKSALVALIQEELAKQQVLCSGS